MSKVPITYRDWQGIEHPIKLSFDLTDKGLRVDCDTHDILAQRRHNKDRGLRLYPLIPNDNEPKYTGLYIPSDIKDQAVWNGGWVFELVEQQFSNPSTHMTCVYKCLRKI